MESIRSFLALELGKFFKEDISRIIETLRTDKAKVKWVNPDSAHMTLHFFGQLSLDEIESLYAPLSRLASEYKSLELGLDTVGVFPSIKRPRIIWIGLRGDIDFLQSLKTKLNYILKKHGFSPEEKKFIPHLTIGRVKDFKHDYEFSDRLRSVTYSSEGTAKVSEMIFFKSKLTPSGPQYTVLKTFLFEK